MRLRNRTVLAAVIVVALAGCGEPSHDPLTIAHSVSMAVPEEASARKSTEQSASRGYDNAVNRLRESAVPVTDDQGKPAVRWTYETPREIQEKPIGDVKLEIVWTGPEQYSWNYSLPELHDGKGLLETDVPSTPLFLERKLGAKTYLDVSIPGTPYSFYIINGHFAPYFFDSEKSVIWRLNSADFDVLFRRMKSVSVSSKRIEFAAPGGDMAAFLILDFVDRENSPKVQYHERYDGP